MKVKEQGPSFEDRLKGHLKGQAACTERTELTKRKVLALKPENLVVLRSAAKGDTYLDWDWAEEAYVGKENRRVESTVEREVEFHERALLTQASAAALAEEFNRIVAQKKLPHNVPKVSYLSDCLFIQAQLDRVGSTHLKGRFFFVEVLAAPQHSSTCSYLTFPSCAQRLLLGKYRKWNTNFGTVSRKTISSQREASTVVQGGLGGIVEEEEQEEEAEAVAAGRGSWRRRG